jgi:TLD
VLLGIGGSTEAFRIFIPDSLEGCVAKASCLTFERGNLLPPVEDQPTGSFSSIRGEDGLWTQDCFDIDCLEIWACGGADAIQKGLEAQRQDRAIRDEVIQKARKVDKAQFFNNAFDAEFLLGETLSHRQQISDRDN